MNIRLHNGATGLCNQLFVLITGILLARATGETSLVVDGFLTDFMDGTVCPAGDVVDLQALSASSGIHIEGRAFCDDESYQTPFRWANEIDRPQFDELVRDLVFAPTLCRVAQRYIDVLRNTSSGSQNVMRIPRPCLPPRIVNVLHCRNEPDALEHWSKMNGMDVPAFEHALNSKYTALIRRYFCPCHVVVVLTYMGEANPVIQQMLCDGYTVALVPSLEWRECSAVVDLLVGSTCCTGTFIGNVNPMRLNGSSFSYVLMTRMQRGIETVLIDLDRINTPECRARTGAI
jgi:hypothetical protein